MSVAELRMGAISAGWGGRRRLLLEQFMRGFELSYADNDLCTVWARIRADAKAAGRVLIPQDGWIAATAMALDAPLATNNRRDYGPHSGPSVVLAVNGEVVQATRSSVPKRRRW